MKRRQQWCRKEEYDKNDGDRARTSRQNLDSVITEDILKWCWRVVMKLTERR